MNCKSKPTNVSIRSLISQGSNKNIMLTSYLLFKFQVLRWPHMLKILRGVSLTLYHIHELSRVHGDIKLDNILIDEVS